MAFSWQTIKYGWLALAGVTITGVTIFVVNNTRQQVQQIDVSELVLGVYERCLATQYATNPVTYYVDPPSFVRDWIEGTSVVAQATSVVNGVTNVSTVTNFAVVTNVVTNAFGWQVDRSMLIELDATIKALVPYYVDTNTVYDGTTNIVMLTVTGLWASLGIGDGTNQFTSVPCWTNPVQTNWIVCYTSYWPTNGATFPTTNLYTSSYNQVVNYGKSWTSTGGVAWASMSNWPSVVVQTTNVATYGDYPWQIHVKDLEERYKVLNALKITAEYYDATVCGRLFGKTYATSDWEAAKSLAESEFLLEPVYSNYADWLSYTAGKTGDNVCIIQISSMYYPENAINTGELCSAINHDVYFYIQPDKNVYLTNMGYASVFNANGLDIEEDVFKIITNYPFGTNPDSVPEWCTPTASGVILGYAEGWSFGYVDRKQLRVADWDFQYCTNKYW